MSRRAGQAVTKGDALHFLLSDDDLDDIEAIASDPVWDRPPALRSERAAGNVLRILDDLSREGARR